MVSGGRLKKKVSSISRSPRRPVRELQRFETVLAGALSAIARVSAHEIDREIELWLGEICLTLDLDRSVLALLNRGVTHRWSREGIPTVPYGTTGMSVSPWTTRKVLAGEELVWSSISDLPNEARDYKQWVRKHGPKAQVALPLRVGNSIVGGITFGKFRSGRKWPSLVIRRLRLVAQVFAAALERKRIETELLSVRSELADASRSTMMGELAASIAHEVNQPLGAILSNAQAARRLLAAPASGVDKANDALNDIVEDAKRAGEVVTRVRALFKGDRTARLPIDPAGLLAEAESLLRSEAAIRMISLRVDAAPSLPPVLGDRVQLLQCVMNLAINAFDSIVSADSSLRETMLKANQQDSKWVRISVTDTGGGIDPAIADRMFDPFVSSKSDGMGMGLLIARSIVTSHGGRISAASNSAGGATVSFTLPVCPANAPTAP